MFLSYNFHFITSYLEKLKNCTESKFLNKSGIILKVNPK